VKKACPNDKDAAVKYEECKKIVTRIRFEKAISVDESAKSVVNQIDLNGMSKFLLIFFLSKYISILF
jgi:serine/threonine-protein phosphatase 5